MNFKEQMAQDLRAVFHNTEEHADQTVFWFRDNRYSAPVVFDSYAANERPQVAGDNAGGIFLVDAVMQVMFDDLGVIPRREETVELDDETYTIVQVQHEDGEIVLYLQRYDE